MSDKNTTTISVYRVPTWLVDEIERLQKPLGTQSRSAAVLALLTLGWHYVTVNTDDLAETATEEIDSLFGDPYDEWQAAGGKSDNPYLNDMEYYILTAVLPSQHGGKRDGAGRPPKGD
jgi:hypothetical protein